MPQMRRTAASDGQVTKRCHLGRHLCRSILSEDCAHAAHIRHKSMNGMCLRCLHRHIASAYQQCPCSAS